MSDLLTTREAAAILGVGTTSIKRWADQGVLACVKTAGGHRRFPRAAVEAMLRHGPGAAPLAGAGGGDGWIDLLTRGTDPHEVYRRIADLRDELGSWWRVAAALAPVLDDLGERWARGEISVVQEHLASERLARALARCAEDISPPSDAPHALLLTAEGDEHTLGLSLSEVVLREAGWVTRWVGARTPRPALESFLAAAEVGLVVVTAAVSSSDRRSLAEQAEWLGRRCEEQGAELVLGGDGAWPDQPVYGHRLRDFGALARIVSRLSAARRAGSR